MVHRLSGFVFGRCVPRAGLGAPQFIVLLGADLESAGREAERVNPRWQQIKTVV